MKYAIYVVVAVALVVGAAVGLSGCKIDNKQPGWATDVLKPAGGE